MPNYTHEQYKDTNMKSLNLGATRLEAEGKQSSSCHITRFEQILMTIHESNKHEAILLFPNNHTRPSNSAKPNQKDKGCWLRYLWAGWQVVVDCEWNLGLLPSDQAVGQREVNKEVLEGAKLGPAGQAQALLLRQGHGFRHPRGDRIWHIQSQLGLPGFRTEKGQNSFRILSAQLKSQM